MKSVDQSLYWQRLPKMPMQVEMALRFSRMFLSNPFGFPEGCVPLMNASFPFIYAKTPGMAPSYNLFASDLYPKCIDTEFDFATGTYKQVMVDWSEFQNSLSKSSFYQSFQSVPDIPVTPVERMMRQTY